MSLEHAVLRCNDLRNYHTQLTMQAHSVSVYTISDATVHCNHLFWHHLTFLAMAAC